MNPAIRLVLVCLVLAPGAAIAESDAPVSTGFFKLSFAPLELLGSSAYADAKQILGDDEELSWQLYVPENYDASRPAGVLVYVSPTRRGGPPKVWNRLFENSNMIWIGANRSGNRVALGKRMFLAMLGPKVVATQYAIDLERVYVAGFSGGGKTAGLVMAANPDLFRGGIYIGGAEVWGSNEPPPRLDIIQQNYHVFLTGTEDFNERLTRRVYAAYKSAGVEHCELIVERRRGHQLPSLSVMARAIEYLDSRIARPDDAGLTVE